MILARQQIPVALVFFLIVIAIVNTLAGMHHWYWTMRWFDMPMHFAGGVWLGFLGVWWYYTRKGEVPSSFLATLAVSLAFAIGVGVMWEVYEAMVSHITVGKVNAWNDTKSDMMFDIFGGTVASIAMWVTRRQG